MAFSVKQARKAQRCISITPETTNHSLTALTHLSTDCSKVNILFLLMSSRIVLIRRWSLLVQRNTSFQQLYKEIISNRKFQSCSRNPLFLKAIQYYFPPFLWLSRVSDKSSVFRHQCSVWYRSIYGLAPSLVLLFLRFDPLRAGRAPEYGQVAQQPCTKGDIASFHVYQERIQDFFFNLISSYGPEFLWERISDFWTTKVWLKFYYYGRMDQQFCTLGDRVSTQSLSMTLKKWLLGAIYKMDQWVSKSSPRGNLGWHFNNGQLPQIVYHSS